MAYQLYYSTIDNKLLYPQRVKERTGIPVVTTSLDSQSTENPTAQIGALNDAQIYPVAKYKDPHDPAFYTTALSYTITNYPNGAQVEGDAFGLPGDYAVETYTATAVPLADAKVAAISTLKERAKTAAEAASDGFPVIALAASASKAASSRDATVQSALDGVNAVLTQLVTDVATVNAATTVADIDTLINP